MFVAGTHLAPAHGSTVRQIEADGFPVTERVEMLLASDTPESIAKSIGLGLMGFSQAFARSRPDILLVLGDRYEMYSAVLAALPFRMVVAHIHGGEVTEGAIDDALRHSMTKLSHIHFVSTETYARRIEQLGEEPWRITISGAPALDNMASMDFLSVEQLEDRFSVKIGPGTLLVTFHPVTLEYDQTEWQITQLLDALEELALPVIFTAPNADTGNSIVRMKMMQFCDSHQDAWFIENSGLQGYFSLMKHVAAMVGNSSSGIIEAPSMKLPVVNIGARQAGRVRAKNVIDVDYPRGSIVSGIQLAVSESFRNGLKDLVNPYGHGDATSIILKRLLSEPLRPELTKKKFIDLPLERVL
jgi:UDP-N-acetylglucosamine 2-epimerase (non-hydrolysing)/GDP/UDP-N,N'-diacetylbacillosamine 2-epimerase (hydrolysing)